MPIHAQSWVVTPQLTPQMSAVAVATFVLALLAGSEPLQAQDRALWPVRGQILRLPAIPWPNWKPGHRGIDLATESGSPVVSPAQGRVSWVGTVAGLPSVSVVSAGLKYTMQPVNSTLAQGDWVGRGELVGTVAASGHCPMRGCLHWSVRRGADYLDPRWVAVPLVRRGSPR